MLVTKIICPHCRKHLKFSKPVHAGHRVLCSRCGHSFSAPEETNGSPPPADAAPRNAITPVPSPPRADAVHVKTLDAALPAAAHSKRQGLWIGLILGGLLFLLAATVGLALYFTGRGGPSAAAAQTAATSPSEDGNSTPANPHDDDVPSPPLPPGTRREEPPPLRDPRLIPTDTTTEPETESWLPPNEQQQVNKTIDRGVQWLKNHQKGGGWGGRIGLSALPALTLLECGVKADDIHVQRAAKHVRAALPKLNQTYDLALAILFLDRLGEPADTKWIRTCALRLVAGQSPAGGWTYGCPILNAQQQDDLLTVLRARRPTSTLDLFTGGPGGSAPPGFIGRNPNAPLDKTIQGDSSSGSKLLPENGVPPLDGPGGNGKPLVKGRPSPADAKRALDRLPATLRNLPSLQPPQKSHKLPPHDASDNSNTQFAILGMLAAGRHDLPLERVYALIVQRFHSSQVPDGGWNYQYSSPARPADLRPAMTGSGLLGLAVQYGLAADQVQPQGKPRQLQDPAVEKGFKYLSQFIGKPLGAKRPRVGKNRSDVNLYFLWTVERCGVLYKRRQIEGKDWYTWGVELLLDHQREDGSWNTGGYFAAAAITPTTDTCFALLFLKRANLAKDLTKKLEFFLEGKKLQTTP